MTHLDVILHDLVEIGLSEKRINNILAVLPKPLSGEAGLRVGEVRRCGGAKTSTWSPRRSRSTSRAATACRRHRRDAPMRTPGTHAAMFGVNPWRLQAWMGHKRIDETMIYVHVAEAHLRELPEAVREAGESERDPDRRMVAMLGARGSVLAATRTEIEQERTISVS